MTQFSESGCLADPETTEEETLRYDESKNSFHLEIQTSDYGLSGLNLEQYFSQWALRLPILGSLLKVLIPPAPRTM